MLFAGPQLISARNFGVPVPAGAVVAYDGTIASIPAGWVLCNGANGTPDLSDRFIIGAGGDYALNATGGLGSVSGSTSTDGAHTGNNDSQQNYTGEANAWYSSRATTGGHAHTFSGTATYRPPHLPRLYIMAQAVAPLPAGAVLHTIDAAAPSGFEADANGGGRFLRGVIDDGRAAAGADTISATVTLASAGGHNHTSGEVNGDLGGGTAWIQPSTTGAHTHTDTTISAPVGKPPYFALLCVRSLVAGKARRRMVLAYAGAPGALTDWVLCDGTAGTPDLRGRMLLGADGTYALGTSGGSAAPVPLTGSVAGATVTHTHDVSSANSSDRTRGGYHASYAWTHAHTISLSVVPLPRFAALHFITPRI